jgi:hypothetical protein
LLPIVVYPFGPAITTIDWSFLPFGLGDGITALPLTIARIDVGVLFRPRNYVGRRVRDRIGRMVFEQQVFADGRTSFVGSDDLV